MSGFGEAMAEAMKRRAAKIEQPSAADKQKTAEEAKRRLGYQKPEVKQGD